VSTCVASVLIFGADSISIFMCC